MPQKQRLENSQLDLKLKESPLNSVAKYKERFELFRAKWDIRKYTKSNWVWFTIVLSLSLILTQIYTILDKYSILPNQIPVFQIFVDAKMALASKEFMYLFPISSLSIVLIGIIFSNKYYNKERDLSNTLLWVMFLSNLIITVALIRLINLY